MCLPTRWLVIIKCLLISVAGLSSAPPVWRTIDTARAAPASTTVPAALLEMPRGSSETPVALENRSIIRGTSPDPLVGEYRPPAATLGPVSEVRSMGGFTGRSFDGIEPPEEIIDPDRREWMAKRRTKAMERSHTSLFGGRLKEWLGGGEGKNGGWFESDHCFDNFISPLSSPFLAEDPRSLTELRPMFLFQTIPSNQSTLRGGNAEYFGLQARIAITPRLSFVLHKLGGVLIHPGSGSVLGSGSGLSEIHLGPKYTFYRDDQSGTLAAAGVQFQIPTGSSSVFQDTGKFSVVPYGSFAQKFGRSSWGEFTFATTLAYSFSADNQRSDFLFANFHLDFDIVNSHKFYAVLEMNWYHYTRNGNARPFGFEGHDFANVGSSVAGRDFLSIAPGVRYRFNDRWTAGLFTEFPLLGTRDMFQFRIGLDVIWRF